ncbi:MAG: 23S rRNA (uracil(1939)-C(5))-methyltransferase RlmD [Thermosynechococcaceae cyanobacterium MS004]|nr:23S rRNA (uracil(1939)-C(5))-methyltransferase RlmD [Thermosynechococcaceae cyanobacterium MS004]
MQPESRLDTWRQHQSIEVSIDDLSATGDGVGHWGEDRRVVFVPDTVPGDRITAKLTFVKPSYAHGQLTTVHEASEHRVKPHCIVADKCGGCQWQAASYAYQVQAKRHQLVQALERIGKFVDPPVAEILAAPSAFGYRNKATYPLGFNLQDGKRKVVAGYYQKRSHRIVNLNQCPVQDARLNPLLAALKQDIQQQDWSIYDETSHRGELRHLSLRIGRRTGEILVTLVARTGKNLPGLEALAQSWMKQFPAVVGVSLNLNEDRTNRIFGNETRCIVGAPFLNEIFAGLTIHVHPNTFFQVYTEQAEALVQKILERLNLQGHETVVDAYCGIGTLTLPIARVARHCVGLEVQAEAIAQARENAQLNGITNVAFQTGTVAQGLDQLELQPDVLLLDPPRKGAEPAVIQNLIRRNIPRIVYMSCNPATLARDLQQLCQEGPYRLVQAIPADFFPQTAHVECAAFLESLG